MEFSYNKLEQDFDKLQLGDSFSNLCGFILGLVATGIEAGNRDFNARISQFYNDDLPLSGSMIAIFSNIGLEYGLNLENGNEIIFPFDDKKTDKDILSSLGQFAYGLCLSLGISKDKSLDEDLHMLTNIAQIDVESALDVNDLLTLRKYFDTLIRDSYLKRQKIDSGEA